MKREVGIAELKANLSKYLRAAQKGREFVVKDRDTPIAKISAFENGSRLQSRMPTKSLAYADKLFDEFHAKHPEFAKLDHEAMWKIFEWTRGDRFDGELP